MFIALRQWSPTSLAPGTGFVEDNFSTDWGVAGEMDGSGSNGSNAEWQMKLHSLTLAHLLLCSLGVGDPCFKRCQVIILLYSHIGIYLYMLHIFNMHFLYP